MKLVTLASFRGAPGVTTTALLLAAAIDQAMVVEADLDGGVLAVRYGLGREPGLTTFAAAADNGPGVWRDHAQNAGGVPVLVGPDLPSASVALWRTAGERLTQRLGRANGIGIVDAGRLRAPLPIVTASDLLVILVRPVAEHLVAFKHHLPALQSATRGRIAAVAVGDGAYRSSDISRELGVRVLAELPDDPGAAATLGAHGGSSSRLYRSRLVRAASALGDVVLAAIDEPADHALSARA